jgi:hypothetical protein
MSMLFALIKTSKGAIAIAAVFVVVIFVTIFSMFVFTKNYMTDMQDMLENSNLPHTLGSRTTRDFSEQDGGNYMETNLVETGNGIWAVVTYSRPRRGSSFNSISGAIWYGDPHEPSFNEEFHVFGFQAGRIWTDDVTEFFTEKKFVLRSDSHEGDEYYGFQQPNGSYYLRFRVNSEGYIIEIMISIKPNV